MKHLPAHTYMPRYLISFTNFGSAPDNTKRTQDTSKRASILRSTDLATINVTQY